MPRGKHVAAIGQHRHVRTPTGTVQMRTVRIRRHPRGGTPHVTLGFALVPSQEVVDCSLGVLGA
jgi:hypothetical protein